MNFAQTLLAGALLAALGTAQAAVTPEEAKKLGTDLTRIGAEKAANADGTIPAYTGGLTTPPAELQGRQLDPPRPLRERKAAPDDHRGEHGQVRGPVDRGRARAAEEVSEVPHRRVSDPPHRGPARSRAGQHGRERDPRQHQGWRPGHHRRHRRLSVPDPEDRQRGDVEPPAALRRRGQQLQVRQLERGRLRHAGAGHQRQALRRVPVLRPEEHQAGRGNRRLLPHQDLLQRPGTPRRRGADGGGRGQPVQASASRLAVPAGPAPREARPRHLLRHAQPGHRRLGDLRRFVDVQRRHGPLRLQAGRQEGNAGPVQHLPADLRTRRRPR